MLRLQEALTTGPCPAARLLPDKATVSSCRCPMEIWLRDGRCSLLHMFRDKQFLTLDGFNFYHTSKIVHFIWKKCMFWVENNFQIHRTSQRIVQCQPRPCPGRLS